ncbi:hypothetical protein UlMin_026885 [Ulmus minor]
MAEALISAVLDQLVSFLEEQLSLVTDAENEFRSFTSTLEAIRAVLKDADRKQVQDASVKRWLDQLKDVSYDMDAVLDEWNAKLGEEESEAEAHEEGKKAEKALLKKLVCCLISSSSSHSNQIKQVGVRYHVASRIKELNGRLDRIGDEKKRYNFVENPIAIEPVQRETTSFKDISEVYGRDVEKQIVIDKLLRESSKAQKGFEVIPVVGMGGIGKTSLAQLVYNDDVVISHFNKRIWVYATDPFDVVVVAKEIALALEVRGANEMANWRLQTLLGRIDEAIDGKKFFLVVDDVWTDDHRKWEPLEEALRKGALGSRILVTTRKTEVAEMMRAKSNMITLAGLSEEVCWTIFSRLAFSNGDKRDDELEQIGRQIVQKCKGLPLAAKTLGSLMSFKEPTREDWNYVLKSELWELKKFEEEVFIPLMLSYYDLPPLEKRCFLFCSYFPKDRSIGRDDLIQLWLSQGYLSSKRNYWEQGLVCFRNLAKRSLFQNFDEDYKGDIIRCKMHDIVHDFALFLTENEFFNMKLNGEEIEVNKRARHYTLLLENQAQLPSQVYQKKNLRALFVQNMCSSPLRFDTLSKTSIVKTLTLSGCKITHVPKNIDKLIYLRYLNLSNNTELRTLPETLCNLVNLQTLKLDGCESLRRLPKGIGKLASLRHLHLLGTRVEGIPKSLRELTNLQTLDEFRLAPDEKEAMTLQDLNQLNSLRGTIRIKEIGEVEDASEAEKAQLKNKEHLDELVLEFEECGDKQATALLEVLQPHPNLKSLGIVDYHGAFPSWMISLVNLKMLDLDCPACEVLPPFGKLQSLESLCLGSMEKVERVGGEFLGIESHAHTTISFPKLKHLQFDYMPNWKEWEGSREDSSLTPIMPCLSSLEILFCDKLEALPNFLRKTPLMNLSIERCEILEKKRSEYVNVEEVVQILTSESGDGGENAKRWRHEERLVLTWPFYISKLHIAIYFLP